MQGRKGLSIPWPHFDLFLLLLSSLSPPLPPPTPIVPACILDTTPCSVPLL